MPYIVNRYNRDNPVIVLEDGTLNTSTSIGLVGRNYTGYGEIQNENFLHLLENFSNPNPPSRPIAGQVWYDSGLEKLNVYDGDEWKPVGSASVSNTAPIASQGALWLKNNTDQFYVFDGDSWRLIGPEALEGFSTTKLVARTVKGSDNVTYAILTVVVNGTVVAIHSANNFTIDATNLIPGFDQIVVGTTITSASGGKFKGNVQGNADTATRLETPRRINGVNFDGQTDITIVATTAGTLFGGEYILGDNWNGTSNATWSIDATPSNQIGTIVARDSSGDFSAGTITADLVGNVQGNVTSISGTSTFDRIVANEFIGLSLSGNAFSATRLQNSRKINGIDFNGTADITVPAAAATLTGNQLSPEVVESSITSLGILNSLRVKGNGIEVGNENQLKIYVDGFGKPIIKNQASQGFTFEIVDGDQTGGVTELRFLPSADSLSLGGANAPALVGDIDDVTNLGHPAAKWNNAYVNTVNSTTVLTNTVTSNAPNNTLLLNSNTIVNGNLVVNGSINAVTSTDVLIEDKTITLSSGATNNSLANGSGVVINGSGANLLYSSSGDKWTVNKDFDVGSNVLRGTANLSSLTMTGYINLHANPINPLHPATKQYVDTYAGYTITYGQTYSQAGFTNQVGSWNFNSNFFDIFPPAGKTMGNLVGFIPSIAVIHYAGGVNGDDSMVCTYSFLADRIRVYVQNTEQRSTPAANWLAFWR